MNEHPTPADTDPITRQELADGARDEVTEAAGVLLAEVHDIDFHHYSDGPYWPYEQPSFEVMADTVLALADRLAQAAQTAQATIEGGRARREWLLSGRPLACLSCDSLIDPTLDEWQVCRGQAEHTWCHLDDPEAEDTGRRYTLAEAEDAAYFEDRARTGGPRPGDTVEITWPDGRTETAIWETGPDGTGAARAYEYRGALLDLTGAARIEIAELAEDAGTPPPDGSPVDPALLTALHAAHADGFGAIPVCGACEQPLPADQPAVWDRGWPLHPHCLPTTTTTPDDRQGMEPGEQR